MNIEFKLLFESFLCLFDRQLSSRRRCVRLLYFLRMPVIVLVSCLRFMPNYASAQGGQPPPANPPPAVSVEQIEQMEKAGVLKLLECKGSGPVDTKMRGQAILHNGHGPEKRTRYWIQFTDGTVTDDESGEVYLNTKLSVERIFFEKDDGGSRSTTVEIDRRDGSYHRLDNVGTPDGNWGIIHYDGTCEDITSKKKF